MNLCFIFNENSHHHPQNSLTLWRCCLETGRQNLLALITLGYIKKSDAFIILEAMLILRKQLHLSYVCSFVFKEKNALSCTLNSSFNYFFYSHQFWTLLYSSVLLVETVSFHTVLGLFTHSFPLPLSCFTFPLLFYCY